MRNTLIAVLGVACASVAGQALASTPITSFEAAGGKAFTGAAATHYAYSSDVVGAGKTYAKAYSGGRTTNLPLSPVVTFSGMAGVQENGSNMRFASAADGVQTAFVQAFYDTHLGQTLTGSVAVDLSTFGLISGKKYVLSFEDVGRAHNGPVSFSVTDNSTTHNYTPAGTASFQNDSFTFVAGPSNIVTFSAIAPNQSRTSSYDFATAIDNLSLASAAPEPASWFMLLIGFGGLGAALRSMRRKALAIA